MRACTWTVIQTKNCSTSFRDYWHTSLNILLKVFVNIWTCVYTCVLEIFVNQWTAEDIIKLVFSFSLSLGIDENLCYRTRYVIWFRYSMRIICNNTTKCRVVTSISYSFWVIWVNLELPIAFLCISVIWKIMAKEGISKYTIYLTYLFFRWLYFQVLQQLPLLHRDMIIVDSCLFIQTLIVSFLQDLLIICCRTWLTLVVRGSWSLHRRSCDTNAVVT